MPTFYCPILLHIHCFQISHEQVWYVTGTVGKSSKSAHNINLIVNILIPNKVHKFSLMVLNQRVLPVCYSRGK